MASKKVAIACQGGGTHAAFTWGVLTTILRTKQVWDVQTGDDRTRTGHYWDGLYSQNPLVRDLLDSKEKEQKPD